MSWAIFELTQHPDVQTKLRAEILATEKAIHARGDSEFTYADFEAMPYTVAVMKVRRSVSPFHIIHVDFSFGLHAQETYRFHPVLYTLRSTPSGSINN